jgi:membrane fusion protein, multidrug efflux system
VSQSGRRGLLLATAVAGFAVAQFACSAAVCADDPPSVLVTTMLPRQGSVPDIVVAYGSVGPAVGGSMTVNLQHEGRVAAIAVTLGQAIRQGDRLIDFDASAATSNAYQQAVSALALARTQRQHTLQLLSQQLATRDQLAQADKALADAQSMVDALHRQGAGQAVQTLVAPFDGVVSNIAVAQGDRVQAGAALLTLTRLDGLIATAGIEPADRGRVRPGQPAKLARLGPGPTLDGKVLRVGAMLNPRTRLIDVDLSLPAGAAVSGEALKISIRVGDVEGWVVPHEAVLQDDKGGYIFQVDAGKAVRVDVKRLAGEGDTDVVRGPIDPTRKLVVQGGNQLQDGSAVREGAPAVSKLGSDR